MIGLEYLKPRRKKFVFSSNRKMNRGKTRRYNAFKNLLNEYEKFKNNHYGNKI